MSSDKTIKSLDEYSPTKLWTAREIADLTGLSEKTIGRYIKSNVIRSVDCGGTRRVLTSKLLEWLDGQTNGAFSQ